MIVVDHGIMQFIIFEEKFKGGWIQIQTFLHAQTPTQTASADITHHTFDRQHVQFFYQGLFIIEGLFEMGCHTGDFQLFHNKGIESIIDPTFTIKLFNFLTIEGRGVVAKVQNQLIGIIGGIDRLGLAGKEFALFFHFEVLKTSC